MSITAGWLILAVILARLFLKKAPKWIPCILWGLVAVRLICPFSLESVFSLIPSSETIPSNIALLSEPHIDSGITVINNVVNPVISESFTPAPMSSANPLQVIIPVAAAVWMAGVVVMLTYALVSYLKLKKTVSVCVPIKKGVLFCDEVKAPFILGVVRPVIYVPSFMQGETLDYVLRHETAHLRRRDHWWKPLGFLLLSIYWFHPLCWIAYALLCRDIEMACDEKVIRDMDKGDMAAYSQALLDCSFPRKRIVACPLAFGEIGVKERVRGVLNYKKPAFWVILIAVIACIALAVCLMTDPITNENAMETDPGSSENVMSEETLNLDALRETYPAYFDLDTSDGLDLYVWQMAADSYSCGLLPGTNPDKTSEELLKLKGATIPEMQAILSTYEIDREDIRIVPWQNPASSYLNAYWAGGKDERSANAQKRRQDIIDSIQKMLFGDAQTGDPDRQVRKMNLRTNGK